MKIGLRFITVKDSIYIRKEDVIDLLMEFGATEETDVRKRIEELTLAILSADIKKGVDKSSAIV